MIPAMTPITIPAIAPGLSPLLLLEEVLAGASTGGCRGMNGAVVVAEMYLSLWQSRRSWVDTVRNQLLKSKAT